jgi:hypothetical protein
MKALRRSAAGCCDARRLLQAQQDLPGESYEAQNYSVAQSR